MCINVAVHTEKTYKYAKHSRGVNSNCLPDDDPVYTLKRIMAELDFSGLLAQCSERGRTGYNPIMIYAVVTYANMRGVRAVDRIEELCERDLAFIWLTINQKPRRDVFYELSA